MISELHNCDCIEFMRSLPDKYFSLAIADPPYNLKPSSVKGAGKLKNRVLNTGNMDWDVAPPKDFWDELFRVSKNQIIWGGNYFNLPPTRCVIAWDKCQPWPNFSQVEIAWTSFDKPAKIFRFDARSMKNRFHPTGKPVELYAFCIEQFAHRGGGNVQYSTRWQEAEAVASQHTS